jgi:hypothetical protein
LVQELVYPGDFGGTEWFNRMSTIFFFESHFILYKTNPNNNKLEAERFSCALEPNTTLVSCKSSVQVELCYSKLQMGTMSLSVL